MVERKNSVENMENKVEVISQSKKANSRRTKREKMDEDQNEGKWDVNPGDQTCKY